MRIVRFDSGDIEGEEMREYELTEEEIYNLPSSTIEHDDYEIAMKAAQKKLLEHLVKCEDKGGYKEQFYFCVDKRYWQSLLKDFGVGV